MEKNYAKEIMKGLKKYPVDSIEQKNANSLFGICQEFYWYYQVYKKSEEAIRVLKNYVDVDNYIAKRKRKESQDIKIKQDIAQKMYAEFFTEIYREYYEEQYSWIEVIDSIGQKEDLAKKILTDYFGGTQENCIEYITNIVRKAYESSYKKIDLKNVHNAIKEFEDALKTPFPSVESSLEKVITQEHLESLYVYLNQESSVNFLFKIAKLRKELFDGTYSKYAGKRNKTQFFNLNCQYNLQKLKRYISGGMDEEGKEVLGLMSVYELYMETKDDLLELKSSCREGWND